MPETGSPNTYFHSLNLGRPTGGEYTFGFAAEFSGRSSYMINPSVAYRINEKILLGTALSFWNLGNNDTPSNLRDISINLDLLLLLDNKLSFGLHIETAGDINSDISETGFKKYPSFRPAVA